MKKTFIGLVGAASLFIGAQANAIPFVDDVWGPAYVGSGETLPYQHSILDDGYNAATDTITSAKLTVWLYDTLFGDTPFLGDSEESVTFTFDGANWGTHTVESSGLDFDTSKFDVISLLNDGILNVSLTSKKGGDFYFTHSELAVEATRVPEPATLALFSLGLLGLGFGMRRKSC